MTADSDPQSEVVAPPPGYRFAGPWVRWGASVIDLLLFAAICAIFVLGARLLFHVGPFGIPARTVANIVLHIVLLAWLACWQATVGASPGMFPLKLRVLGPNRQTPPSVPASVVRNVPLVLVSLSAASATGTLLYGVGIVIYVAVFVTIARSPTQQGFHDRLAGGTYVVRRVSER